MSLLSPRSVSAMPLVTRGTAEKPAPVVAGRTRAVPPEPGLDGERRGAQQGRRAERDASLAPVELDGGAHRALRRSGRFGRGHSCRRRGPGRARRAGKATGADPLEDAPKPYRGLERPRGKHTAVSAGGPLGGAQQGRRAIDHEKRQNSSNSEVFHRIPTHALHLWGSLRDELPDDVPGGARPKSVAV